MNYWRKLWNTLPRHLRRAIVLVIGFTLIVIGLLLIILPGPFTLPFVIGGLVLLAGEFVWAEKLLKKGKDQVKRVNPRNFRRKRDN